MRIAPLGLSHRLTEGGGEPDEEEETEARKDSADVDPVAIAGVSEGARELRG